MAKEIKDIESGRERLAQLQAIISQYNDLEFNLQEKLNKQESEIKGLQSIQGQLRKANFRLFESQENIDTQIADIDEKDISISDILGKIL